MITSQRRQSHDVLCSKGVSGSQVGIYASLLVHRPRSSKINQSNLMKQEQQSLCLNHREISMAANTNITMTQVLSLFPHASDITPEGKQLRNNTPKVVTDPCLQNQHNSNKKFNWRWIVAAISTAIMATMSAVNDGNPYPRWQKSSNDACCGLSR